MGDKEPPITGPFEDTESIDVATLVTEVTSSGSFDVTQFRTTSFGKLLNALPVPALLIDDSYRIIFANQACSKINPEHEKLLDAPVAEIFYGPEAAEKIQSVLKDVFSTRRAQTCEAVLGTHGAGMWGRLFCRSVRVEDKRLLFLLFEDLTLEKKQLILSQKYQTKLEKEVAERKKAEKALEKVNWELEDRIQQRTLELMKLNEQLGREIREREFAQKLLYESQQRLELALKGADLGLWDYDVHKSEAFVDQRGADILGYPLEEMRPEINFWRSLIHPDERPRIVEAWNAHLEGRTPFYEVEQRVRAKSGQWKWVLFRGKVVERDPQGEAIRVSGTIFDVTDRKRAEEKLLQMSKVFMESIDPIFVRDLEGNVIDLNRAAEETYGWRREELTGKPIKTIVSPIRHEFVDTWHEQCKRGEKVENVEALHRKKSGEVIPVLLSLSLLTNSKGEPVGIASISKDLTDLKRTEEMLRAKTEALERSNQELEEFAYVAAHDLREPLVGIGAYLKVLHQRYKDTLDAEASKCISRALDITLRMDYLIQSLLSYSRLGIAPESLEPTDCSMALDSALRNLRSSIEESGARVTSDRLPIMHGNASQMVQLFQNLVSNAIKYAGDRPLEIHVGVVREKSTWKFCVKDNGIGIEPQHADRIFQIFQRVEAGRGRPGTGIGLASCKKIVEHHGGRIWVESEPDKGSTFFFTIPDRKGTAA